MILRDRKAKKKDKKALTYENVLEEKKKVLKILETKHFQETTKLKKQE